MLEFLMLLVVATPATIIFSMAVVAVGCGVSPARVARHMFGPWWLTRWMEMGMFDNWGKNGVMRRLAKQDVQNGIERDRQELEHLFDTDEPVAYHRARYEERKDWKRIKRYVRRALAEEKEKETA